MNKKNRLYLSIILLLFISFAPIINATENYDKAWDFQYRGIRAMGMGNSFGSISNDSDAFLYNPAGFTSIRKFKLEIQPIRIVPTQAFYNETKDIDTLIDDIDRLKKSSNPLDDPNLQDERIRLMNKINNLANAQVGADLAIPVRIIFPLHIKNYGVTVGAIAHEWVGAQVGVRKKGLNWENFVIDMLDDEIFYKIIEERVYGLSSAICFPIPSLPLKLSLGLGARRIERSLLTNENNLMNFADIINPEGKDNIKDTQDDFKNRFFDPEDPLSSKLFGSGFAINSGIMASLYEDTIKFGLTSNNLLGGVKFDDIEDKTLKRTFGVSTAINIAKLPNPDIPFIDLIASGDYDKIVDDPQFHLGLEMIWRPLNLISISGRIGNNNGFLTLGAGIQLMFLDIDYAFYGDEITNWHGISLNLAF